MTISFKLALFPSLIKMKPSDLFCPFFVEIFLALHHTLYHCLILTRNISSLTLELEGSASPYFSSLFPCLLFLFITRFCFTFAVAALSMQCP